MTVPTPWFLKEPPTRGKPPLDRVLNLYGPYLRYQLERGALIHCNPPRPDDENPNRRGALKHLLEHAPATIREIAEANGFSAETVRDHVNNLRTAGFVEECGKRDNANLFRLTKEGKARAIQLSTE